MSSKRRVRPFFMLSWNNIGMRIEENGREFRVGTRPFENDQRLALDEFNCVRFKGERFGLRNDEISSLIVLGAGLDGINLKVLLKPGYDCRGRRWVLFGSRN